MCIELYVDKLLVYSNCMTPSPSPVPSPIHVDNIFVPNTSPTPSNTTYDMEPIFTPLPDHTLTIAIIMTCTIIPCIIWMICACAKRKKKPCQKKVQPQKKCCTKEKQLPTRGTQTN